MPLQKCLLLLVLCPYAVYLQRRGPGQGLVLQGFRNRHPPPAHPPPPTADQLPPKGLGLNHSHVFACGSFQGRALASDLWDTGSPRYRPAQGWA